MAKLKNNQRYVIIAGPQQHGGPGTRSFSDDGTSTEYRSKAAKFFAATEGIAFAERNNIIFSALISVGLEDFTDFELSR
jgi:hypothetical protein